jgi:hypothetical protein
MAYMSDLKKDEDGVIEDWRDLENCDAQEIVDFFEQQHKPHWIDADTDNGAYLLAIKNLAGRVHALEAALSEICHG